jgi:hypothetical protein
MGKRNFQQTILQNKFKKMNKEQEKIAVEFINTIKNNNGLMSSIEINRDPIKKLFDFKTDIVVIDGLVDLGLIDNSRKSVFRLTQKGWKFKSFKKLHFENRLQLINTKVILLIAIITILLNLYQTFFRSIINKN